MRSHQYHPPTIQILPRKRRFSIKNIQHQYLKHKTIQTIGIDLKQNKYKIFPTQRMSTRQINPRMSPQTTEKTEIKMYRTLPAKT